MRSDVSTAHTAQKRRGRLRVIWKTIKWAVIAVVLLVTALVIAVIVALIHMGKQVEKSENQAKQSFRRAARQFRDMKTGMTAAQVRALVGKPTDVQSYNFGGTETCWYCGSILVTARPYEFCFKKGRLISKSRLL